MPAKILDYINGEWTDAKASDWLDVINPAEGKTIGKVVMTSREVVAPAVQAGQDAFREWRTTPVLDRVQYLFKLRILLEEHLEEIAKIITNECGKTCQESIGRCAGALKMSSLPVECPV